MRHRSLPFRLLAALIAPGLALAPMAPALAQPVPPPGSAPALADPPSRVGRLARMVGTVSFHTADQTQWEPATLNYPVTSGNSFWTEPRGAAEIEVGPTHVALAESTEFDVDTLADHAMAATQVQGETYLRLRAVPPGDTTTIRTPRGEITIGVAGRYDIVAGDTDHPTTVTVIDGAARIVGPRLSLDVGPRQTASLTGSDNFDGSVGPEQESPFLRAQLQREVPPPATARAAPPPSVQQMTGADALETTGEWTPTPQYGEVWYPPVQRGWVPYREGHWAWVAPWGWTWVDNASWGFAPFHYGRWVEVEQRWGWIPRIQSAPVEVYPVYAPALVSFVDVAAGVLVGAAIGRSFGWIPLGAREPYYPPYRSSPAYLRQVNVGNVTNVTTITNIRNTTINNYANRGAATVVPASVVQASQPVAPQARAIPAQQIAQFRPVRAVPVQPTLATVGVTPGVARAMNLRPVMGAPPPRPIAPGPIVQARPAGIVALRAPGGAPVPATTPVAAPQAQAPVAASPAAPGEPARPGLGAVGAGALLGGAAGLGGAALLNRNAQPRPAGLPPLSAPRTASPGLPGMTPGPAIAPRGNMAPGPAAPIASPAAPAAPSPPRPTGLPPLSAPRTASPDLPGVTPGPAIAPRGNVAPGPAAPISAPAAPVAPAPPRPANVAPPAVRRPSAPVAPAVLPPRAVAPPIPASAPPAPRASAPAFSPPARPAPIVRPAPAIQAAPPPSLAPRPVAPRPVAPPPHPAVPPPRAAPPPPHPATAPPAPHPAPAAPRKPEPGHP